jgi:DHA3 family tetracycline resistance protein-like MFS transporter
VTNEAGPAPRRKSTFGVLRHRDFALLWSGQTVSQLGDGIFTVALALEALDLTHRPSGFALVIAARMIPTILLALVSGVVVDRVSRQLAMLVSDVVRGASVMTIAILTATGHIRLWELVVMSAVFGIADSFFNPASYAVMPELLEADFLVQGNALNSTSSQMAVGFLGPAVGGSIVGAVGTAWAFGMDAASFAVSALCLALMRRRPRPALEPSTFLDDAKEGVRYVKSERWLWLTLVAAGIANLTGLAPVGILVPLLVRVTLHSSPFGLGLIFAAGGIGGVVASLIVARLGSPKRMIVVMWSAYGAAVVPICAMSLSRTIWLVGVCVVVEVGLIVYGDVLFFAMLQRLVPQNLLGRVSSVLYLMAVGLMPLGTLLAGVLATVLGIRVTLFLSAVVTCATTFILLFPDVRDPAVLRTSSPE